VIRRATFVVSALVSALALAAGCGQDAALVGGECAAGLTECALRCVDLSRDPANCGACGHACDPGVACVAGACATAPFGVDATVDGSSDDGAANADGAVPSGDANGSDGADGANGDGGPADANDAGANDASANDASANDASDAGTAPDGAVCVPPYDNLAQCGSCQTACVAPDDVCAAQGDGSYACAQLCTLPLVNCGGACVDRTDDPFNCGACGKVCPSHLCVASTCQGSTPGDIVLIGHDYATTPSSTAQGNILQNAVSLPTTNPLRVMSFERYSDGTAVSNAKAILAMRATQQHRTIAYTVSVADGDVPAGLRAADYDVLIVHDQKSAPAGALATLGGSWAVTLGTFTKAGGVVVVLDGDTGTAEMPQFTTSGGLFSVTSHAAVAAGSAVTVTAQNDDVGFGVLNPYGVWNHTATFTLGSVANVTLVVRNGDGTGDPIVAHRIVP
jgi:Stigma-specific protein, Stig1